jgi:hypothetical protein
MRIEIFDVGHGQCAVITAPNADSSVGSYINWFGSLQNAHQLLSFATLLVTDIKIGIS